MPVSIYPPLELLIKEEISVKDERVRVLLEQLLAELEKINRQLADITGMDLED